MKKPQELAVIFAHIAEVAGTLDSHAAQMLAAIKLAGCDHLEEFNAMVSDAYAKNSWSQVQGRPSADSTLKPAPDAVKLYVSTVRAAYRLGLQVTTYESMGALRVAIKEARAAVREEKEIVPPEEVSPELKGVQFTDNDELTGATMHDVLVLYKHLPENSQIKLVEEIRKLVVRYVKAAPEYLSLAS